MTGRFVRAEAEYAGTIFDRPDMARRREVLRETLAALSASGGRYHRLAEANHRRWAAERPEVSPDPVVAVLPGDWGAVTLELSRRYGAVFAVLNMANAYLPGGRYVEGTVAQEENMFRRTDCHFAVARAQLGPDGEHYTPEMTALLSGEGGRVLLDTAAPRVCLRGGEERARPDLGYPWLADDEVFSFYELRAAAVDRRGGEPFDREAMQRRIAAQFATLDAAGCRHVVLGAFGCGAFANPAAEVAAVYRAALDRVRHRFAVIAFAVFHAGYGPDNFTPFQRVLS